MNEQTKATLAEVLAMVDDMLDVSSLSEMLGDADETQGTEAERQAGLAGLRALLDAPAAEGTWVVKERTEDGEVGVWCVEADSRESAIDAIEERILGVCEDDPDLDVNAAVADVRKLENSDEAWVEELLTSFFVARSPSA